MDYDKEIKSLRRAIFRTRVGGILGLGIGLAGLGFGIHHLGEKHHEVFSEFYEKHRTPRPENGLITRLKGIRLPGYVPTSQSRGKGDILPEQKSDSV